MQKKILILSRKDHLHPKAGGAEIVMQHFMQGLVKEGYLVTHISPLFKNAQKNEQIDGIIYQRMFSIHTIYFCFWSRYLFVRKEEYDIIIDHAGGIPLLSPLYIRNKPILFFTHHVGTKERAQYFHQRIRIGFIGRIFQWIYNTIVLALYRNKLTITVSEGTAQELRKWGFSTIHVIPNTTDYPRKRREQKTLIPFVLTTVGRIVPNKQFDHALMVLKGVRDAGLFYHLHIVGALQDQYEYDKLQTMIREYQLSEWVTFHGKLNEQELIALRDQTRWGLVTSDKEGFGMSILEANSRGVPVIGYDIPGVNEVIRHGINGYCVEKNSIQAVVDCIIQEDEYSALCEKTEEFIEHYPTREHNTTQMNQFLYRLLQKTNETL